MNYTTNIVFKYSTFQIDMDLNFSFSPSPNKRTRQAAGIDRFLIPLLSFHPSYLCCSYMLIALLVYPDLNGVLNGSAARITYWLKNNIVLPQPE